MKRLDVRFAGPAAQHPAKILTPATASHCNNSTVSTATLRYSQWHRSGVAAKKSRK